MTAAQPPRPARKPDRSGRAVTWQGIEAWSAGLTHDDAAIALVLAGARMADLNAWREDPARPVDWRLPSLPDESAAAKLRTQAAAWVRDASPGSLVLRVREPEMAEVFERLDSTPAVVTLVSTGGDVWARPQYGAAEPQQAEPGGAEPPAVAPLPMAERPPSVGLPPPPPARARSAGGRLTGALGSAMDWLRHHPLPRIGRGRSARRSAPRPPMGRPVGEQPPPSPRAPQPPPVPPAPVQVPDDTELTSPGDDVALAPLPEAEPPVLEPDVATEAEEVRLLQVELNAGSQTEANLLRSGDNDVGVFVGPKEQAALQAAVVTNAELGFVDEQETVTLTVELIPQVPAGEVMRQSLAVPRSGRSGNAAFVWHVPATRRRAQARLTLLDGVRVIQTAVLSGTVDHPATLQALVLRSPGERPERVIEPDVSLVLNHDRSGARSVIGHRPGKETVIEPLPEIDAPIGRIRSALIKATQSAPRSAKARDELLRKTLVDVAVEGRDLQGTLSDFLGDLDDVKAIQVVSARPDRFMPLELLYGRPAPDDDARLCQNWIDAKECGPGCFADEDDTTVVCPAAFWGMSRIIERQHADPSVGSGIVVYAAPTGKRPRLALSHPALGHSAKVKPADVSVAQKALGPSTAVAKDWGDWVKVLTAEERDLLVLMPHTDAGAASMEIDGSWLRRGRVEARHVTGGHDVHPLVVLFGCDTGGSEDDPAGYATRFMVRQAAVVFSTLTMLLASHAAALSSQLTTLLLDQDRKVEPMGAIVQRFRREALRSGLLAALAVTAYGDAEWQV